MNFRAVLAKSRQMFAARSSLEGTTMAEPLEDAVEAEDKKVALIIAILALFLALSEAGGKNAEHRSTEQNIEASDLYNFYQAKKVRSTVVETAARRLKPSAPPSPTPRRRRRWTSRSPTGKATIARFEKDTKNPQDSLDAIQERAKAADEAREFSNRQARAFRIRQRRAANRDRAGLGGDHHGHRRCSSGSPWAWARSARF